MTIVFSGCELGGARGKSESGLGYRAWEIERLYRGDSILLRQRIETLDIDTSQRVLVEIEAEVLEGVNVQLPSGDQMATSGFVVNFLTEQPVLLDNGRTRHLRRYFLEPFLSGQYSIPEMAISWLSEGQETSSLLTEPITVRVSSVLANKDKAELREVGDPFGTSVRWWRLIVFVLSGIVIGIITVVIILWRRRIISAKPVPEETPAKIALRALEGIEQDVSIKTDIDRFYVEVSSIVRRYIDRQFGLHAPEQTSEEFLSLAKTSRAFDSDNQRTLERFLQACDAVKFAKAKPAPEDTHYIIETGRGFVRATSDGTVFTEAEGQVGR